MHLELMDADFIVSLKHIPSLWVEDEPRDIERQFNRHIALIEKSLSVVPRLETNDFGSNFETTRRAVHNELSINFAELCRLERSLKRAKEKALLYWLNVESLEEMPDSKSKVQKAILSFYDNRQKLISVFKIKIAETLAKYFAEQMLKQNSLRLIQKTLPENNPLRRRIESHIETKAQPKAESAKFRSNAASQGKQDKYTRAKYLFDQGMSYGQIGKEMGINKGTLHKLLNNSRVEKAAVASNVTIATPDNGTGEKGYPKLTQPQQALLLIYNNEELDTNAPRKLQLIYNKLNTPGAIGDRERRCTKGSKRGLKQRLVDLEIIHRAIKSQDGLLKWGQDMTAIQEDYDDK
jgi:DNA-binding NarL/FixJ family response regulator